jgi:GNAT superfamily N-acetyltransferase
VQDELIETAARVVGVYLGGQQVGFCRAVADRHTVAYLADVYILPEHRGHGLGRELVVEMVDNWPYGATKWLLHTSDAHELYRSYGFTDPGPRLMERWPGGEGALPQAGDGPGGEAE